MNHLSLIIKREYLAKVKNKSFIIMTFMSPLIMVGLAVLISYLSSINNDKVRSILILDQSGFIQNTFVSDNQFKYSVLEGIDLNEAKALVKSQNDFGLLHIPEASLEDVSDQVQFFSDDSPSLSVISDLESRIEKTLSNLKLENAGVDLQQIQAARTRVDIMQESFAGVKTSKEGSAMKLIFGGLAGYLLFLFIIIYGNMIMRSVIEEKSSRIIEVIISSVKPIQLMLGKIIGTSLAGLTQFFMWMIVLFVFYAFSSSFFGYDMVETAGPQQEVMTQMATDSASNDKVLTLFSELSQFPITNLIVAFILFFIGGYLLYSSLYAAIGAAVDNETDTQQFLLPILVPLFIGIYVGVFTVIDDPHGTVSTVFSHIPFTSPVVMLMRVPFGVPIWEQLLSFGLLVATFSFMIWFASKIYRVGILMYGKKPTYKELVKWLRY